MKPIAYFIGGEALLLMLILASDPHEMATFITGSMVLFFMGIAECVSNWPKPR